MEFGKSAVYKVTKTLINLRALRKFSSTNFIKISTQQGIMKHASH